MSSPGWWPDPTGRHEMRYHDGSEWTEHVSNRGVVASDPLPAAAPVPQAALPMPEPASSPAPPSDTSLLPPTSPAPSAANPFAPPSGPYVAPYDLPSASAGYPVTAPSPLIQPAGPPKRLWLLIGVVALLVVVGAVAFLASRSGDDGDGTADRVTVPVDVPTTLIGTASTQPSSTESQATPPTAISTPESATTAPSSGTAPATAPLTTEPSGAAVPVGTSITAEGNLVRVNRVTPNVAVDDFFAPAAPVSVTAVEVEACAGPDGFAFNSFSWTAFQADNTTLENFYFSDDIQSLDLAPGGCGRGIVTFEVPGGGAVASIVVTGSLFEEIGRWIVDGAAEPIDRLQPPVTPTTIPVGKTVTFGAGHTVTLRSVTDDTPPLDDFFEPDPGRQYSQLDVELCSGTESLSVNGLYWFGVSADSWIGTAALLGDTLPAIELAAGQCAAGIIQIDLPEGSVISQVVYIDTALAEVARWQVG